MKNRYIQQFEDAQLKDKTMPAFKAGDTLRLGITIKEGEKTQLSILKACALRLEAMAWIRLFACVK